jgi:hypothetical protein
MPKFEKIVRQNYEFDLPKKVHGNERATTAVNLQRLNELNTLGQKIVRYLELSDMRYDLNEYEIEVWEDEVLDARVELQNALEPFRKKK